MKKCRIWDAVLFVTLDVHEDTVHPGYYVLIVTHAHKGAGQPQRARYELLTPGELCDVVDAELDACRPGFRHTYLQALQQQLWPD